MSEGTIRPYTTLRRALKINHLLFADDVLLFANGEPDSISKLLVLLNRFCEISGEQLNPAKSQIIFSSRLNEATRDSLCHQTGFAAASLPITYLGAPLYKGRTLVSHFQHLSTNLHKRLHGWANRLLSMGGRVELIRSVLCAMSIHSMLTLPVPLTIIDNMVSIMSAFLWSSGTNHRRHWINWDRICIDYDRGGLNIRHPRLMLQTFKTKRAWDIITSDSLWARYARSRFKVGHIGSPLWNAISPLIGDAKQCGTWRIGNGNTLGGRICSLYGISSPPECHRVPVHVIMQNDSLFWSFIGVLPIGERPLFRNLQLSSSSDRFVCKLSSDGRFTCKAYYKHLISSVGVQTEWGSLIWCAWIPPKISCFVWKLFHKVVPTDDTIMRISIPIVSKCSCCRSHSIETMNHLFFESEAAISVWSKLAGIFDRPRPRGTGSLTRWLQCRKNNFLDELASGLALCTIWEIWKMRNDRIHNNRSQPLWYACLRWAGTMMPLIRASYISSTRSDLILAALRIQRPNPSSRGVPDVNTLGSPATSHSRDDSAIPRVRYTFPPFQDDSHYH